MSVFTMDGLQTSPSFPPLVQTCVYSDVFIQENKGARASEALTPRAVLDGFFVVVVLNMVFSKGTCVPVASVRLCAPVILGFLPSAGYPAAAQNLMTPLVSLLGSVWRGKRNLKGIFSGTLNMQ